MFDIVPYRKKVVVGGFLRLLWERRQFWGADQSSDIFKKGKKYIFSFSEFGHLDTFLPSNGYSSFHSCFIRSKSALYLISCVECSAQKNNAAIP